VSACAYPRSQMLQVGSFMAYFPAFCLVLLVPNEVGLWILITFFLHTDYRCLTGEALVPTAVRIIEQGHERQKKLCEEVMQEGSIRVVSRNAQPPVFITVAEYDFYTDDKNKTIRALRGEFEELLTMFPQPVVTEWREKMKSARRHKDVEDVVKQLRSKVVPSPNT